jgi:hypothetical protein
VDAVAAVVAGHDVKNERIILAGSVATEMDAGRLHQQARFDLRDDMVSLRTALPLRKPDASSTAIFCDKLHAGLLESGYERLSSRGATAHISVGSL